MVISCLEIGMDIFIAFSSKTLGFYVAFCKSAIRFEENHSFIGFGKAFKVQRNLQNSLFLNPFWNEFFWLVDTSCGENISHYEYSATTNKVKFFPSMTEDHLLANLTRWKFKVLVKMKQIVPPSLLPVFVVHCLKLGFPWIVIVRTSHFKEIFIPDNF